MNTNDHVYLCIDLKSFYASVECVDRGLDPLTTNLVVADESRTEKTICLAVTPALKAVGVGGRARLFEVIQKVKECNLSRKSKIQNHTFLGKSINSIDLFNNPNLELDYIIAPPRMARYMEMSSKIYSIYLKYIAPEDIHVYSVDEVFVDLTQYLRIYNKSSHELTIQIIRHVLSETGITATAGIGSNMYLAKIAMDIVAKKMPPDPDGVRIAELDELSYRRQLWDHEPLTDFWRVGSGYQSKLKSYGIHTMGDIAYHSLHNEELLYRLFGVNAELLIDHAWGYEPCTIEMIKKYKPEAKSLGSGQVLHCPYNFQKARLIVSEMVDQLALDLCDKGYVSNQLVLTIGYDIENLTNKNIASKYHGDVVLDYLGRKIPKHAHGTANLDRYTYSSKLFMRAVLDLYDKIVDPNLLIRRINISASHVILESEIPQDTGYEQMDFFTDYEEQDRKKAKEDADLEKEKAAQKTILDIKKKFGKNAILKGFNLEDGATMKDRNEQVGGHKA